MIRTFKLFIIINSLFLSHFTMALECTDKYTDLPPAFKTSTTNQSEQFYNGTTLKGSPDVISEENLRDYNTKKIKKKISRGTFVALDTDSDSEKRRLLDIINGKVTPQNKDKYIKIVVRNTHDDFSKFKDAAARRTYVNNGDKGAIYYKSIDPVAVTDVFVVNKDTELRDVQNKPVTIPKDWALKPITLNGKFKVNVCCEGNDCKSTYLFNPVSKQGNTFSNVELKADDISCKVEDMTILGQKEFDAIKNIQMHLNQGVGKISKSDLKINDFGRIAFPVDNDGIALDGSFYHHTGSDPKGSDTWGKAESMCTALKLAKGYRTRCIEKFGDIGCRVQFGDMGFATPGTKANGKDILGHKSHADGECIDIRPPRTDNNRLGTYYQNAGYSRQRTQILIDMAIELGASKNNLYFNDRHLTGAKPFIHHDNHLHICFPTSNSKVKESCTDLGSQDRYADLTGKTSPIEDYLTLRNENNQQSPTPRQPEEETINQSNSSDVIKVTAPTVNPDEVVTSATHDISSKGVELIAELEGFVPNFYNDNGAAAIGYGIVIETEKELNGTYNYLKMREIYDKVPVGTYVTPNFELFKKSWDNYEDKKLREGTFITKEGAKIMLHNQLETRVKKMNQILKRNNLAVTQKQFDALVSLYYNYPAAFSGKAPKFMQHLKAGNFTEAAYEMRDMGKLRGHNKRRFREMMLLMNGEYTVPNYQAIAKMKADPKINDVIKRSATYWNEHEKGAFWKNNWEYNFLGEW